MCLLTIRLPTLFLLLQQGCQCYQEDTEECEGKAALQYGLSPLRHMGRLP